MIVWHGYEIDFPKLKDTDMADLQKYTSDLGNALSRELLKFNSQLAEAQKDFENLGKEVEENIKELEDTKTFIENSMKTLSAEGTSIHVNDSADYPCKLKVEGKSEQIQTETSPSPDYPSEIENVSGDLEVKVVGKNLMKCETEVQTKYGVTITKTDDGGYILNGTSTGVGSNGISLISFQHNFPLLKNNSYAYSIIFENIPTNDYVSFPIGVRQLDGTLKYNYKVIRTTATAPVVFVPNEDLIMSDVSVYILNGTTFNDFKFKIQIEKGTVATAYEPYKEQTVTFPFAEGQKLYKDGYLASDGIHNKRTQIILDGTETVGKTSSYFQINVQGGLIWAENVLSNYFKSPRNKIRQHWKYMDILWSK